MIRSVSLSILCILLSACGPDSAAPDCCEEELVGQAPIPDTSIYQLESLWTDQADRPRHLVDFRGGPVILAMIFTTCEYACPRILADLKAIEAKLTGSDKQAKFLLVSFDPERDRPAVLAAYAAKHGLDPERWTLLTGDANDVRELAAVLGVKYKRSKAIGFSHSNSICLLDGDGRIAHQLQGLGADPASLLRALRTPVHQGSRPDSAQPR